MTHCEWLEEHGFINIKDHWNGNWNYRTYQKIYENGDLIEVDIEIDSKNLNVFHNSFLK